MQKKKWKAENFKWHNGFIFTHICFSWIKRCPDVFSWCVWSCLKCVTASQKRTSSASMLLTSSFSSLPSPLQIWWVAHYYEVHVYSTHLRQKTRCSGVLNVDSCWNSSASWWANLWKQTSLTGKWSRSLCCSHLSAVDPCWPKCLTQIQTDDQETDEDVSEEGNQACGVRRPGETPRKTTVFCLIK